jgi:ligand-binding sensor domain-containing protein
VTTLFQDRGGVLWVGTYFGLNKWNYLSDAFTYFHDGGSALSLSSNIVTSVAETADGQLWVGTYGGGLNRIDFAANSVRHYRASGPDGGDGLPNDKVMALYVDARQSIWIGTRGGGLTRPASNSRTTGTTPQIPRRSATITSLVWWPAPTACCGWVRTVGA